MIFRFDFISTLIDVFSGACRAEIFSGVFVEVVAATIFMMEFIICFALIMLLRLMLLG